MSKSNDRANNNKTVRKPKRPKFEMSIFRLFGAAALIVSTFLLMTACADSSSDIAEKTGGLTAGQIIENPTAYVGKTVTVSGDVEEIHGPRAFNMDSGASVGELLVVGREPFPNIPGNESRAYVINDVATVTGTVRLFVTADVEREIGWDLDPKIEADFNGKPVLIVSKAEFRAGTRNATMPSNTGMNQPMNNDTGQMEPNGDITDVLMIVAAPDATPFVGRRVRLSTVKVQKVVGDRSFYVGPGENQRMLVVFDQTKTPNTATEGKFDINEGQTITLNGVVKKMPSVSDARAQFGDLMSESELNKIGNQKVYISAENMNVVSR